MLQNFLILSRFSHKMYLLWQSKCHLDFPQWCLPWVYQVYWEWLPLHSSTFALGNFIAMVCLFTRLVSWYIHQASFIRTFLWIGFQTQISLTLPNISLRETIIIQAQRALSSLYYCATLVLHSCYLYSRQSIIHYKSKRESQIPDDSDIDE